MTQQEREFGLEDLRIASEFLEKLSRDSSALSLDDCEVCERTSFILQSLIEGIKKAYE